MVFIRASSTLLEIILWSLLLMGAASAHKVVDSNEDIGPEAFANVTTLYPVANQQSNNITNNERNEIESNNTVENNTDTGNNNTTRNNSDSNINKTEEDKSKAEATSWKIEAAYAESNLDKNSTIKVQNGKEKNYTKNFKPSQHVGSIVDDVPPTRESYDFFAPVMQKPASSFTSSKEEYHHNKLSKEILRSHHPYKFQSSFTGAKDSWRPDRHKPFGTPGLEGLRHKPFGSAGLEGLGNKGWSVANGFDALERPVKSWSQENTGERPSVWDTNAFDGFGSTKFEGLDSLDPKPTVEAPVKVPAGGFYQYADPFKDKPGNHDGDFGLEFNNDVNENAVMKRGSPWEGILRMLTAFIPVGIIISALTPSIVSIENTGPQNTYPSNVYRGAGPTGPTGPTGAADTPHVSERCRRRLLCELHDQENYTQLNTPASPRQWQRCRRIRCADPAAVAEALRWLLDRQNNYST